MGRPFPSLLVHRLHSVRAHDGHLVGGDAEEGLDDSRFVKSLHVAVVVCETPPIAVYVVEDPAS